MIYLDNSATTRQYDEVTAAMVRAMQEDYGNPSSLYQLGVDAEKAVKAARRHVLEAAGWFAASDWDVVFTSGGTEADNMAIFGAAKALRRQGNRIITTAVEHPAVLECMKQLESEGFEVIRIGVDARCNPDMEQLEEAIDGHTILVSMMHVNNEVGTVMPVGKVKEIMRSKGVPGLFHCDAVQSFGKMPLPSEADLISVSGHKIHGPKGSGALLMNRNTAGASAGSGASGKGVSIPAFIVGGGQESGRRSGTENVPAIIGLGCAAKIAAADGADDAETDKAVSEFAISNKCILIYKNSNPRVASKDGSIYYSGGEFANSGLAKGGSGDVLAGLVTGLLAQFGQIPDKVCQASVRIHSLAGRLAAGKYGEYAMIPSDIAEFFPEAFRQVIG